MESMEAINLSSIPKTDEAISSSPAKTVATVNGSSSEKKLTKSVSWSEKLVTRSPCSSPIHPHVTPFPGESNAYVSRSSSPSLSNSASFKDRMDSMKNVIGKWSQNVKVAAKRAEDLAENTWQHFKTSPSLADAAMGRLVHSSKVLAEGGYEKIFFQTFNTLPDEVLQDSYACYLSTSAGPVMGTLFLSTEKLAFCSDNPLPFKHGDLMEWSYYKVIIPLDQLKAVNRSSNRLNAAEKYIQIITITNHEFWYMGFLKYEDALTIIQAASQFGDMQSI